MTQSGNDAQDPETSGQYAGIRLAELIDRNWIRKKCADLATREGIILSEEHRGVLLYLRKQYLLHALPRYARTMSRELVK